MTGPADTGTNGDAAALAVSVCVFRGDTVLMVERGKDPGRGLWAPVGGHVEPGESMAAAALRETLEETGVVCAILGESSRREIRHGGSGGAPVRRILLVVHAARWISGEPVAASDAAGARFVRLDRLAELPLVEGVLPHIDAARRLYDGFEA